MLVAACTVTLMLWAFAWSWMLCCIAWKNGLSSPLMIAAALPLLLLLLLLLPLDPPQAAVSIITARVTMAIPVSRSFLLTVLPPLLSSRPPHTCGRLLHVKLTKYNQLEESI